MKSFTFLTAIELTITVAANSLEDAEQALRGMDEVDMYELASKIEVVYKPVDE